MGGFRLDRVQFVVRLRRSELQACGKIEAVTLDTPGHTRVVSPAHVEIEVALTFVE
jgi:hypothetical protein